MLAPVEGEDLDDLVQRLAVARYALDAEDLTTASDAVDAALVIARRLMTDRLTIGEGGESLLRRRATTD
jgi:hypothetical protein